MQSKARMTFRFDPPKPAQSMKKAGQPVDAVLKIEEQHVKEEAVFERGFTSFNSPYQDDIHALEEIIRRSDAVVQKTEPIHAPHPTLKVIPSDELSEEKWSRVSIDHEEESLSWLNQAATLRDGPSWGRVFLSVTAAVATGALFGYMVLSLFTGEPLFPGKSGVGTQIPVQASPGQSAAPLADSSVIPKDSKSSEQALGEASLIQIPTYAYFMLQYGVFQNEKSMQAAVQQLEDKGLESAVETSDGYRVYVGAAVTRDEAELLAAQMSEIELYIKPISGEALVIPAATLPAGAVEFMNSSSELIRKLAIYSGTYLQDRLPQKMNGDEITALQEAHRQWLTTAAVTKNLNGEIIEDGKKIVQSLNSAILTMTEYNRKPSRSHLLSVQSEMMKALLADRHMRMILQSSTDR
jgi:hypothetical protein